MARPILNPVRIKGKGRLHGALSSVLRIVESSTKRLPSSFELPPSSVPAILDRLKLPTGQVFVVQMGLKQPSSTVRIMTTIENGYADPYEPGTRRERVYIYGISLVYQEDNIEDVATIAGTTIEGAIEIYTRDTEWDLDDLEVI